MEKKEFRLNYGGREVIVETGRLAKQADGSVLVTSGSTQVLVTACSAKKMKDGQDFFPLTVDYTEKFFSAGKFLGGFNKREARPTTKETLNARLIDRPLRPLFPEGYMFETVVQATVMSYGPEADPEILAGLGASAALAISDIPFNGPIGTCKVGRIDGQLVLNPTHEQWEQSDMEIAVAASKEAIMMVEGEAQEVVEEDMLAALTFAHDSIKEYCALVDEMVAACGKKKREFVSAAPNETLMNKVTEDFSAQARECLNITDKLERQNAVAALEKTVSLSLSERPLDFGLTENDSFDKESAKAVDELLYNMMRNDILKEEKRIGGRKLDEVRQIWTETNVLKRPHGSSLFTRGETQVLATATLGGSEGDQMVDRIQGLSYDKFYLHYAFPPYSVGEARGVRGVGRRELGHGNLAERAIKKVLPSQDDFPYTIRVFCEVTESNGSSSMGSVCSGSMALMDAGVPLKSPVAGIAMGLVKNNDEYKILTDILGDEDHLGDMDFKVAGTDKGITAIQMDIKIEGITKEIMDKAMHQAKAGRMHILGEMSKTISSQRAEMKDGVPRFGSVKIEPDKIGALIGPGGKNIKAIQEKYAVSCDIEENGNVRILGISGENIKAVEELIDLQINGPKVGTDYEAVVVSLKEYGAFVDIADGVSGLVHVSELANERVNDVNDYVNVGDTIGVRVLELDKFGRLKLSAKAVKPLEAKKKE